MATKNYILKVLVPTPGVGEHVINVYDFKKLLEAMQTPEEEIQTRIRNAVEYQKQQMVELGFSDEEAEAKILALIESETQEPVEEVVEEEPAKEEEQK